MGEETISETETQADFIRKELNFDINPDDPVTKASLNDHPVDEWIDILGNDQLKKRVIKKGKDGTRPNRGDICTLNITGKLMNGKVVEEHNNLVIQLGDMEVIQGLDLAIALMDVDEIAEIVVDPRFGYGKRGNRLIPSNAVLTYTVELKAADLEPEIEALNVIQRREIGIKKRERGNWWFVRSELTFAIQCYRKALEYLSDKHAYLTKNSTSPDQDMKEEFVSDTVLQRLLEDRMKVHNNLAAALIRTEAYDAALENVEIVLNCQPQNEKAMFRKGRILKLKGEYAKAYATFLEVRKLNPDVAIIHTELTALKDKIAKDTKKEKHLYRKMLGIVKETGNSRNITIEDRSKITQRVIWSLVGGASVVIVGILIHRFVS